jgi:NAD(P)-dependent dehydrogenase (short-subunit alcohol dehydrogenase family)
MNMITTHPICVITGATSGIGLATAVRMATSGYSLLLVGRTESKARAAVQEVQQRAPSANVEYLLADLSSMDETRRLAAEIERRCSRLDVLINNAGGIFSKRFTTVEGLEHTFALNHLSHFLLTAGLLGLLKTSGNARIVNVASDLHRKGDIHFDDLQLERGYSGLKAYTQSKLANVLFTFELARRLQGSGVSANCLHPGVVATGFGHNNRGLIKWYVSIARPFLLTAENAAATPLYLAAAPEVAGVSGRYFKNCKEVPGSPRACDPQLGRRLWDITEEMCDGHVRAQGSVRSVA